MTRHVVESRPTMDHDSMVMYLITFLTAVKGTTPNQVAATSTLNHVEVRNTPLNGIKAKKPQRWIRILQCRRGEHKEIIFRKLDGVTSVSEINRRTTLTSTKKSLIMMYLLPASMSMETMETIGWPPCMNATVRDKTISPCLVFWLCATMEALWMFPLPLQIKTNQIAEITTCMNWFENYLHTCHFISFNWYDYENKCLS